MGSICHWGNFSWPLCWVWNYSFLSICMEISPKKNKTIKSARTPHNFLIHTVKQLYGSTLPHHGTDIWDFSALHDSQRTSLFNWSHRSAAHTKWSTQLRCHYQAPPLVRSDTDMDHTNVLHTQWIKMHFFRLLSILSVDFPATGTD